jgi:AcrR family transcriptional regulator
MKKALGTISTSRGPSSKMQSSKPELSAASDPDDAPNIALGKGHRIVVTKEGPLIGSSRPRAAAGSRNRTPSEKNKIGRVPDAKQGTKKGKTRPRREQQRAIATRLTILNAAVVEFAQKGFEGASARDIGRRAGIQHQLITHHYPTKDALWRAVAEHFHEEIHLKWETRLRANAAFTPRERVREALRAVFEVQMKYPEFHHFMLSENRYGNSRLKWLAETILSRVLDRVIPPIQQAQAVGALPQGNPVLVHYMMVGMASALSSLGAEITAVGGLDARAPEVADAYLDLMERVLLPNDAEDHLKARRAGNGGKATV